DSFLHREIWMIVEALTEFPLISVSVLHRRADIFSALTDATNAVDNGVDAEFLRALPTRATRLAGQIVGVAISATETRVIELEHEGKKVDVTYVVRSEDAEAKALAELKDAPALTSTIEFEPRASEVWAPRQRVAVEVDHLFLLLRASPLQRVILMK